MNEAIVVLLVVGLTSLISISLAAFGVAAKRS